ncbi:hypothetical protein SD51_08935 [Alicyclobacillus tengchongensis]|nr:hypothetical protein SD51_08935 [Alicyclobacillus tengchongensis]
MKNWKVWAVTVPAILIMMGAAVVAWLWRNLSTNWAAEQTAAQFVLNHTPIDHLQAYHVFTASGLEDVFQGTDAFHREWYAFYLPTVHESYAVPAANILSPSKVAATAKALGVKLQATSLGYVTAEAADTLPASQHLVYEIKGTTGSKLTFLYLDAVTGRVLWKYQLQSQ